MEWTLHQKVPCIPYGGGSVCLVKRRSPYFVRRIPLEESVNGSVTFVVGDPKQNSRHICVLRNQR